MDIRNCKRCGVMFNYKDSSYCTECMILDDKDFQTVKEYLYDNPKASMIQVSKDTNVSAERIKRYLKEGRLEIIAGTDNGVLNCESCRKTINSGRYCDECARKIGKGLKTAANSLVSAKEAEVNKQEQKKDQPASGGYKFMNKDKR